MQDGAEVGGGEGSQGGDGGGVLLRANSLLRGHQGQPGSWSLKHLRDPRCRSPRKCARLSRSTRAIRWLGPSATMSPRMWESHYQHQENTKSICLKLLLSISQDNIHISSIVTGLPRCDRRRWARRVHADDKGRLQTGGILEMDLLMCSEKFRQWFWIHTRCVLRYPRRSVKRKRCRCVRSKRWRRQRRWNTNLIFFNYPAFAHSKISRILIELNWGVTDSLSLSLRYFTKVALLFSKGVQSRSNWGVPRHWGDMHTTVMWLQCELTRLNPNYSARYQISKGTVGINIYHI